MPERGSHPPAPGPVVTPNTNAIEDAVRDVTFPISKRDLLDQIDDEETVVLAGRNVDLRLLVRDLNDDFFETEDEFRGALELALGQAGDGADVVVLPPTSAGFPEELPTGRQEETDQPTLPEDNA